VTAMVFHFGSSLGVVVVLMMRSFRSVPGHYATS
jgi:hypothetical protein